MTGAFMRPPQQFRHLTQCFWDGSVDEAADEREWIEKALRLSSKEDQIVIKRYLDELLKGDPEVEVLQKAWDSGGPVYGVSDRHIRTFLETIRDLIPGHQPDRE